MAEPTSPNVEQLLGLARRRALWVVLCCLLAGGTAYGLSKRQAKQYTATASLVFNNNQQAQQVAGLQAVAVNNQQSQQQTNLKLVQRGDMAEKTASKVGRGLTGDEVRQDISVGAEGESNIVDVAATAALPALAAAIANTYADQFVSEQQNSNHAYYASALTLVDKQLAALSPRQRLSPAGLALAGRAQSLGVLAELKNGNVEVVQAASVPRGPSSPKTARNTILGGLLGLLLGLGLAFLLERLDRRIREPKDLEAIYGLPLLGVIPESKALSRGKPPVEGADDILPPSEAEAFHLLRAHLRYFNVDRELRTLLVASAAPGDGKSTVARHLAAAAARMGSRALLIEVDFRRPTLAQELNVQAGPGLADVLIGAVSMREATQPIGQQSPSHQTESRSLDVLVAGGTLPPNPAELLESQAMKGVLESAKSLYDLIIIDTPPLTAVSDAFPLLHEVDGVIIVGRVGRNRRDVAQRLHETLTGTGAPLLGVVANGFKSRALGAYGYSYGYAAPKAQRSSSSVPSGNGASPQQPAARVES